MQALNGQIERIEYKLQQAQNDLLEKDEQLADAADVAKVSNPGFAVLFICP